jgi:WD40 repeat protein
MARICRGQGSSVAPLFVVLLFAPLVAAVSNAIAQQLYEQPQLVIDPGMHTGVIRGVGIDNTGRFAVTGGEDETLRVWSASDGTLLRTIRMPMGPGYVGKVFALGISPDGSLIVASGPNDKAIYMFGTQTGKMITRIADVSNIVCSLAFSPDGRYLAAGLCAPRYGDGSTTKGGLRVYDHDKLWAEAFHDLGYASDIYGLSFAADGRLATASFDGVVRLYDRNFKLMVFPRRSPRGDGLFRIAFNPRGNVLVVGHSDSRAVDLFDGNSLRPLQAPEGEAERGDLSHVAWSNDGKTLYASGGYANRYGSSFWAWANAGSGERRLSLNTAISISDLAALPDGNLLVVAQDPFIGLMEPGGKYRWSHRSPNADFRNQYDILAVSGDGALVDFGFDIGGKAPLRFDVRSLKLIIRDPKTDFQTRRAVQDGLPISLWRNGPNVYFGDPPFKEIRLRGGEFSRSLAINYSTGRFVLGTDSSLLAYDTTAKRLWTRDTPGQAQAVNISGDGRLLVAAYSDGTIRWHRMDDGRELLALYVLADQQNWVAWTPEGFYGATPGAFGVLKWHVNRGFDVAADAVPVSAIPRLRRPDALPLVLQEMEMARALGIADLKAARRDVQIATHSAKAPGARLHVLTIGVSDYGEKAKDLRLKFAHRDAQDVATALLDTQGGGLMPRSCPSFCKTMALTKLEFRMRSMQSNTTWQPARVATSPLSCSPGMGR